jgi:hypothetical protein
MDRVTIRRGARAPESLRLTYANDPTADEPLDLTIVSAASLSVLDVYSVSRGWDATIVSQATNSLVLTHTFAASGLDVAKAGRFEVMALLTTPSGQRRAGPIELIVL